MIETDVLKLREPAENDFYSVEDFNHNMEILEKKAASKIVTLRVCADLDTTVAVTHSSGIYSAISTVHEEEYEGKLIDTYAEFILPEGGEVTAIYISGGSQFTQTVSVIDGNHEWFMAGECEKICFSLLARVPDNHFQSHNSFQFVKDGKVMSISKTDFATFQSGYSDDAAHKSELWDAVRCGMITSSQYQTITGEAYPEYRPKWVID